MILLSASRLFSSSTSTFPRLYPEHPRCATRLVRSQCPAYYCQISKPLLCSVLSALPLSTIRLFYPCSFLRQVPRRESLCRFASLSTSDNSKLYNPCLCRLLSLCTSDEHEEVESMHIPAFDHLRYLVSLHELYFLDQPFSEPLDLFQDCLLIHLNLCF